MNRCWNWAILVAVCLVVSGALFVGLGLSPRPATVSHPNLQHAIGSTERCMADADEPIPVPDIEIAAEWKPAAGFPQQRARPDLTKVRVTRADAENVELEYAFPQPVVQAVQVDNLIAANEGNNKVISGDQVKNRADVVKELKARIGDRRIARLALGRAPSVGGPGEPVLPVVPSNTILPFGRTIAKVEVVLGKKVTLDGKFFIPPGQKPIPLLPGAKAEYTPPDPRIYNSDNVYPASRRSEVNLQHRRGVAYALVNLNPVEYQPKSGTLSYYESIRVKIATRPAPAGQQGRRYRPDPVRPLDTGVDNPGTLATYETASAGTPVPLGLCDPAESFQYVVVTSQAIRDATTTPNVNNLIAQKQACGLTATVVTIESILASYTGVDNAEKLRNFIKDAYANWETDYVLLGGDTNIIPMRKLTTNSEAIPSDLYYQCLDGNYNNDNDSVWGETTDGVGGGDVDLLAEVYVGRASAGNATEFSNFVFKTLAYENEAEGSNYLRKALVTGEYLGSQFGPGIFGYAVPYMEEIRLGASTSGYTTAGFAACPSISVDRFYDYPAGWEGNSSAFTWTKAQMIAKLNSNSYSMINHLGHANYNYVMRFYNADADALTNDKFFFLNSQGCIPGNFEVDCIAEHLTTSTRHGAFAAVLNARYGWGAYNDSVDTMDGPSQRLQRQFWDAFFEESIFNLGALNADSHEDNVWCINGTYIRWCVYESNLFGDPHTRLRGIEGPCLSVVDRVLDDSAGDGDGILNPGESIAVTLTVQNVGTEPVYGAQAELTTADPMLSIAPPATLTLGDLAPGETAQAQYTVTISPSCPTPHSFALTLNMTDNAGGAWSSDINAPIVRAAQISVSPTTLSQTLEVDQSASQVVTVANGTSAEETLTWNASVAPPGYAVSDSDMSGGPAYNWIEISGSGTRITGFGDDTNLGPYNIGFSFPFYGGSFSTFRVCSNGWLSFTSSATSYSNASLPSSSAPENLAAFFWDDLNFNSGGAAYYQLIDAETLVVQFNNVPYYADSTKKVTCQVLLKADGSMIFQYKLVNIANSCTIGIQNGTADEGVQVAYNQAYVRAGLAVQLTPQTSWLTVAPASGSTSVGASSPIDATFDSTGLAPGDYSTEILISSNDPQNPLVVVPVTLTVDRPDGGTVVGECGTVTINQSDANQWHTVILDNTYTNPVVVMGPLSFNGADPSTVRVKDVTANSFAWQIDEYDYKDGGHTTETVGYLVVEAGVHTLEDGTVLQAGTQSVGDTATPLTFPQAFAAAPVVVSQAVTVNDGRAVVTRQRSLTTGGLELFLQSQEASGKAHDPETVAWIAMDKGTGTLAGLPYEVLATSDNVKESWFGIGFTQPFAAPPVVVAAMQTCDGGDTAGLRYQNLTASGVDVKVEEEESQDSEVTHTTEIVGAICLPAGDIVVPSSVIGECGTVTVDQTDSNQWHTVTLENTYTNPVVVIGPPSFNGGQPTTVRVKNVTANSFEWQMDEYEYLDGYHTTETVGYLVVEAGVYTLEGGIVLQAGTQSVGDTATPLTFPQAFAAAPVVVSQAVTVNDARAVVTRQRSLTAGGLEIFLQSQEASGKAHGAETVAWIAVDKGSGTLAGLPFEALATNDSVKESWFGIGFSQPFAAPPVVVGAMQTCDGGDTAGLRHQNLTASGVDVKVEEETSKDSEVAHTTEVVGLICLGAGNLVPASAPDTCSVPGDAPVVDCVPCVEDEEESGQLYLRAAVYLPLVLLGL